MNPLIQKIDSEQLKTEVPELEIGSTLKITIRIEEEGKERLQAFTGILIAKKSGGLSQTMTVRKTAGNYSVERIFLVHSPRIISIEVIRRGVVRRAKLYYLRDKIGKAAKIRKKD